MTQTIQQASEAPDATTLARIDAFWRACNYLAAGMIYLRDNPLLEQPLQAQHIKQRLLGHWGASPALSFTWAHLNRVIVAIRPGRDLPGRSRDTARRACWRRCGSRAPTREVYPESSGEDREGMREFFRSSRSRAASAATCTPERPARSTRAANSATALIARLRRGLRQPGDCW
jgi:xylulose-5-phosphate/fructose-6-phosphate phosphoketolase